MSTLFPGGQNRQEHVKRSRFGARAGALACGAIAALGLASMASAAELPMLLVGDFESGNVGSLKVSGNAPKITTTPTRKGKYAVKTELHRATSPTSFRTEFTMDEPIVQQGGEYWYGFSIFLPEDYVADPIWEIVAQWHSRPDNDSEASLNPPMSLHTENGEWMLSTLWDSRPITDKNYEGKQNHKLGEYRRGVWTDWVFHVKWSPHSDGLLQVWQNGKKVIDKAGPIGFNDQKGPYFKFGLYKGWRDRKNPAGVVSSRTLYHDEIRVAAGPDKYSAVAPGGRRPAAPGGVRTQP